MKLVDITVQDFEELMWAYEAEGRKALDYLGLSEEDKDFLSTELSQAMKEYNNTFPYDEEAPWYGEDPEYTALIDDIYTGYIDSFRKY